jgi:hypothetical protein
MGGGEARMPCSMLSEKTVALSWHSAGSWLPTHLGCHVALNPLFPFPTAPLPLVPQVLYSSAAWLGWLHALPTRHLAALYIKYLFDSFQ